MTGAVQAEEGGRQVCRSRSPARFSSCPGDPSRVCVLVRTCIHVCNAMQADTENQRRLGQLAGMDGMDTLLQVRGS